MSKPIIGILGSILISEGGSSPGLERAYVNNNYVEALVMAGAVPLLLPVVAGEENIKRQLEAVDGLLLPGGYDINPLFYGEEPHQDLDFIMPELDDYQLMAAQIADVLGMPMFGICRGQQVLNVAFGGTLYQDLGQIPTTIQHNQKAKRCIASHTVALTPGTVLAGIFGKDIVLTNSLHHQAVKDIAPGFIVNAVACDGVIEGIERPGKQFTVAVQWHPEAMVEKQQDMQGLFREFVAAVKSSKK